MIKITEKKNCSGCGACAQSCPISCISMREDEEGFCYPVVDEEKCIHCKACLKTCPIIQPAKEKKATPKAYAICHRDEEIRRESSSGGVFSLLAEAILSEEGVVYGAEISENGVVAHARITKISDLWRIRGSKYIQSKIENSYILVRKDLERGYSVLFTGTPCQIEGLHNFLRKDYPNLFCMDIICHGVPSPMVWKKYIVFRERIAKSKAVWFSFRGKTNGWRDYELVICFANGMKYVNTHSKDLFMRAFLKDMCLRPSCYACAFKTVNRVSDITAGDFWGIQNVYPEMDDNQGTSLAIVHSEKGKLLFETVANKMRCQEVDVSQAIASNRAMIYSAPCPRNRDAFFREIRAENFDDTVNKFTKERFTVKLVAKRILVKLGLWELLRGTRKK